MVYVFVADTQDTWLDFLELYSVVLSEYNNDVSEEGEELNSEPLPTSTLRGPQQRNGKRKMLPNF